MGLDAGRLYWDGLYAGMDALCTYVDSHTVFGDAWYFSRCLQKMIRRANFVCGICKMDCMSTEKIVCLLKNAGDLQSIAVVALVFFHRWHLAPATLRDSSKMPGISSVRGDQANHERWCCPPLLIAEMGSGLGHSQCHLPVPGVTWEGSAARQMSAAITRGSFSPVPYSTCS